MYVDVQFVQRNNRITPGGTTYIIPSTVADSKDKNTRITAGVLSKHTLPLISYQNTPSYITNMKQVFNFVLFFEACELVKEQKKV